MKAANMHRPMRALHGLVVLLILFSLLPLQARAASPTESLATRAPVVAASDCTCQGAYSRTIGTTTIVWHLSSCDASRLADRLGNATLGEIAQFLGSLSDIPLVSYFIGTLRGLAPRIRAANQANLGIQIKAAVKFFPPRIEVTVDPLNAEQAQLQSRGYVDAPRPNQTVHAGVGSLIGGWWIAKGACISKISIFLDGQYRGEAVYGYWRPDLNAYVGWNFLQWRAQALGNHKLEVRVYYTSGFSRLIPSSLDGRTTSIQVTSVP